MNDAVNIRMCLEDLVEVLLLSDVDIVVLGSLAGDELDAIDRLF
jgi:lipopolysaccharide biosynthesis glycosyltransferase